jgi:hypothetical protein
MTRHAFVATTLAMLLSGSAFAQDIVVSPEQETVIREYVTKHKVAPADVTGVEIAVGATLPELSIGAQS